MSFSPWERRGFQRSGSGTEEDARLIIPVESDKPQESSEDEQKMHAVAANIQQVANNVRQMLRLGDLIKGSSGDAQKISDLNGRL